MARRHIVYRPRKSKALTKALDDRNFRAQLTRNMFKATRLNGLAAEALMRRKIQQGLNPRNAALTQMIKGDDKPLVDSAELFVSITSKAVNIRRVFAGVLRNSDAFDVAVLTHNGTVVKVTERMRSMFFNLWLASGGGARTSSPTAQGAAPPVLSGRAAELFARSSGPWYPLKRTTTRIVIPARRWVDEAFKDPALRKLARRNWKQAYQFTFQQIAQRSRG